MLRSGGEAIGVRSHEATPDPDRIGASFVRFAFASSDAIARCDDALLRRSCGDRFHLSLRIRVDAIFASALVGPVVENAGILIFIEMLFVIEP